MPDGKAKLPPRVEQELREDARKGRKSPALKALRIHSANTHNQSLLKDYYTRHHIDDDLDEFHQILAQQSQGIGLPFELPTSSEYQALESGGDFRLGTIGRQGQGFHLDLRTALPLGLNIIGGTGTGKTTLLTSIAKALSDHQDVGCWLFNVRNELNSQLPGFTNIGMSEILPNLFEQKQYLHPKVQASKLADIIASAFYLLWSKTPIAVELAKFYTAGKTPSLIEVRNSIAQLKAGKGSGLQPQQLTKLVGVFEFLRHSFGEPGSTLRSGFQPEKHWKDKLVILMDVGDQSVHALLITWALWRLYEHNIAHNLRDRLRTAFIVDESRYLLSLDRERSSADYGSPVLDDIICTQRSAGLALIAATQTAHPKNYSTNTATKVALRTGDTRYFHLAAQSMGLSRQQEDWAKLNLGVGEAVITTFSHPKPLLCLIKKPEFKPEPEHLKEKQKNVFLKKVRDYTRREEPEQERGIKRKEKPQTVPGLVNGALPLLKYAAEHPLTPVSHAYKTLNLGADQGNKAKQHLEENELAKSTACRFYKGRGRQPVFLEPTGKGISYLNQHYPKLQPRLLAGRGGLEHRVHAHLVARHYVSQGYIAKKEHCDADLGLEHPKTGKWLAVEIANKNSRNLSERIASNQQAGAERTLILASDETTRKKAARQFKGQGVEVIDLEEFLLTRGEIICNSMFAQEK